MESALYEIPSTCPVCGYATTVEGQFLYCRSRACPVQLSGAIHVWVNRLGLLHWGDALIDALTDPSNPKIAKVSDLYRLSVDEIAQCCSGMKLAQKCYDVLHSNKNVTLSLLIASLNIPNLATSTAQDIIGAGYDTVEKILELTPETLRSIRNIGKITAAQVFEGLRQRRELILDLMSVLELRIQSGALSGKSFCITEATEKPRKMLEKMILDNGGQVKGKVSAELTSLITNYPNAGTTKMKAATRLGIPFISEQQFLQLLA